MSTSTASAWNEWEANAKKRKILSKELSLSLSLRSLSFYTYSYGNK
jgi:hypothetical protein